ncbi:hypothetical protein [Methylocella sp. CPCC 101449]|uniref:hypothetical protein n=1 Tax=Methylocella sp. CPCC 101449 TaxID=2987531 RepID=UPI00288D3B3F|nr:hypothetical protein [Methylocella sp. CPCC 101449]MDT2022303.1 hypothetical protein [Methylocella sp. CPCC 101449]
MAEGYDVIVGKNGRVFVVLHPACKITKEEILGLLGEMGIDPSLVIFLLPGEVDKCVEISDASVIIPVDTGTSDLLELEEAGRYSGQAGGRVVVLFGKSFPYEDLHPIAKKYGTQCGWSAEQLKVCISGKADEPRSGAGTPVSRPNASQVKC